MLPERPYTKELQRYLEHGREKCRATIAALTEEAARRRCTFEWLDLTGAELLLYNMRHVQHHAAQLHLILRQTIDSAPRWVARASALARRCPAGHVAAAPARSGLVSCGAGVIDAEARHHFQQPLP